MLSTGDAPKADEHDFDVELPLESPHVLFDDRSTWRNPWLPTDLCNYVVELYCHDFKRPQFPPVSAVLRALALECGNETTFNELFFSALLHYVDDVYEKHKDALHKK